MKSFKALAAFASALLLPAVCSAAPMYTVTDLGTLGGGYSGGSGINASGQVAGFSRNSLSLDHAFLYNGGVMQDLGTLGAAGLSESSYGRGINDSGQVVGTSGGGAFLYSGGAMQYLGSLSPGPSDAFAINNSGQVAGASYTQHVTPATIHAIIYSGGVMNDLGSLAGPNGLSNAYGINASGQVVGYSEFIVGEYAQHAFLYSGGVMTDLNSLIDRSSGWELVGATAINDIGQITGYGLIGGGMSAFLFSGGVVHDLGAGYAYGLNSSGQVVGQGGGGAFLYSGGVRYNLNTLLVDPLPWGPGASAAGINDSGQITGWDGLGGAFLLTPIPEPSTLVLAALGFAGLLGHAWRRKQ